MNKGLFRLGNLRLGSIGDGNSYEKRFFDMDMAKSEL